MKFWVVCDETGETTGSTYDSLQEARTAAEEASASNDGAAYFVCEAMQVCETKIEWKDCVDEDEPPASAPAPAPGTVSA